MHVDAALEHASAADEQRWTRDALAGAVEYARLRVWRYREPAVVLGCGQRALATTTASLPVEVRPSGGGAVLVGPWMLGAGVVLPASHPLAVDGIVESFRWLGEACAGWLRDGGVAQAQAQRGGPTVAHWACFAGRGPWEVMVAGRKVVGLAQARRRHAVLLSVGVLIDETPWALLAGALGRPVGEAAALAGATVSAAELLGSPPDADAWASGLLATIKDRLPSGISAEARMIASSDGAGGARCPAHSRSSKS
jgi:lipoate-protein ligase A